MRPWVGFLLLCISAQLALADSFQSHELEGVGVGGATADR